MSKDPKSPFDDEFHNPNRRSKANLQLEFSLLLTFHYYFFHFWCEKMFQPIPASQIGFADMWMSNHQQGPSNGPEIRSEIFIGWLKTLYQLSYLNDPWHWWYTSGHFIKSGRSLADIVFNFQTLFHLFSRAELRDYDKNYQICIGFPDFWGSLLFRPDWGGKIWRCSRCWRILLGSSGCIYSMCLLEAPVLWLLNGQLESAKFKVYQLSFLKRRLKTLWFSLK